MDKSHCPTGHVIGKGGQAQVACPPLVLKGTDGRTNTVVCTDQELCYLIFGVH